MKSVTLNEAVAAIEADKTYRLSVYYGKNGKYSIDRGQMDGNIKKCLLNVLAQHPFYGLQMD